MKVTVIGAGSWGTAVAGIAATNCETTLWARRTALATAINERHGPGDLAKVLPAAAGARHETVDHGHAPAGCGKSARDNTTDEPGPAGNHHAV